MNKLSSHELSFPKISLPSEQNPKNPTALNLIITPIMRRFAREELKKANAMTRSLHGDTGVYFIQGSPLILKLQMHPTFHILADRFLQQFGFHVPHYGCLSRESKIGTLAFEKLQLVSTFFEKKIETYKKLSLKTIDIEVLKSNFQWQWQRPFVTVMKKVEGTTFTKLEQDKIKLLFSDPSLLKNLGKMIFLDFFIGNRDRISPTGCNTGNFLLLTSFTEVENPIALIDHDYNLNSNTFNMLSKSMDELLDKKILPKLIFQLKNQLEFTREKLHFDEQFVLDCIYEGVIHTAHSLVEKFSDRPDLVHELLDIPATFRDRLPSNSWPDTESFFRMLVNVKQKVNLLNKTSLQTCQKIDTRITTGLPPSNNSQEQSITSLLYYIEQETFDHDDIQMIDCHIIGQITLGFRFIYDCLKDVRLRSCGESNLNRKVQQLRMNFAAHLEKCVYLLQHVKDIKPNTSRLFKEEDAPKLGSDPWLQSTIQKPSDEEQLVAASLHIRNILFTSKEVVMVIPEKAEGLLKVIEKFNSTHLPQYLAFLANMSEENKNEITNAFQNLQSLIEENQLQEIPDQLSRIRKLLRHSNR